MRSTTDVTLNMQAVRDAAHSLTGSAHDYDWLMDIIGDPALERAIGVIYRPDTERASHYFYAQLRDQFDVVLHFDETGAVEPLERTAQWEAGEVPETYPFAV